jgi:hypothetical protein
LLSTAWWPAATLRRATVPPIMPLPMKPISRHDRGQPDGWPGHSMFGYSMMIAATSSSTDTGPWSGRARLIEMGLNPGYRIAVTVSI